MGRPINPKFLGDPDNDGFQISGTVLVDVGQGVEGGVILRQRSNSRYLVEGKTSAVQGVCKLVNGVPDALGEMSVSLFEGGLSLINGQTQAAFNSVGANGTFTGGTGYSNGDVITLSNGATITVTTQAGGVIDAFSVTTAGSSVTAGVALTQTSVAPAGGVGFTLTPGDDNVAAIAAGYAKNINNRTVKTFDDVVLSWPATTDVSARNKADIQGR